jgi:hypothetical protein
VTRDQLHERAVELVMQEARARRAAAAAVCAGSAGFALGAIIGSKLAPLAIVAAAVAGLAYRASR